ncbi:uncharacterized protein METZ01_LOCUS188894, partial [marine metagenome]
MELPLCVGVGVCILDRTSSSAVQLIGGGTRDRSAAPFGAVQFA